ncbi:uncharacterized protein LOC103513356 [Diaphorina citri]|uniref:Uncharacterized protein LOC103513356 n=1 Tax=Diaphorina citri TaxID=121845 RepID=A0A3Q0J1N2_DIACI|nr:uncharacterized protein LOC103513356 [Diaphorina citri]
MAGDSTEPFEESPEPESDLDPRIQAWNYILKKIIRESLQLTHTRELGQREVEVEDHSGALVNDVFLSVSGFLTAYSLLKTCGKLKGRAFDSLIRSRFIAVLSRLSFWVHLLNVPFQQMMAASSRTSGTFSVAKLIWGSCGDVIYLYSLSLILYLIVEVPVIHLMETMFSRRDKNQVKNDLKHQDNTMERKNV